MQQYIIKLYHSSSQTAAVDSSECNSARLLQHPPMFWKKNLCMSMPSSIIEF